MKCKNQSNRQCWLQCGPSPDGVELFGLALSRVFSGLLAALALQLGYLLLQALQSCFPVQLTPNVRLLVPLHSITRLVGMHRYVQYTLNNAAAAAVEMSHVHIYIRCEMID